MTAPYVQYDTLSDRRDIYRLLDRLPPEQRLAWMSWVCSQAKMPHSMTQPRVQAKTRALARQARWDSSASAQLTLELYFDVWQLAVNFELDFEAALRQLEEMARRA
jgi:hypothetical protein